MQLCCHQSGVEREYYHTSEAPLRPFLITSPPPKVSTPLASSTLIILYSILIISVTLFLSLIIYVYVYINYIVNYTLIIYVYVYLLYILSIYIYTERENQTLHIILYVF